MLVLGREHMGLHARNSLYIHLPLLNSGRHLGHGVPSDGNGLQLCSFLTMQDSGMAISIGSSSSSGSEAIFHISSLVIFEVRIELHKALASCVSI